MCGIVGVLTKRSFDDKEMQGVIKNMSKEINHRGPDDFGIWLSGCKKIAFAHQRLSILDLSNAGHQPMISSSERYVITFNGEIYNHLELRVELEKKCSISWRGMSDTETLLAAIEQYGLQKTLTKIAGMFAFCLWDEHKRELHLVRDRFGEKPLYYGWTGSNFIFASELKALKKFPKFSKSINREALDQYLRLKYVPHPYSIYTDTYKLEPGSFIRIKIDEFPDKLKIDPLNININQKNFEIRKWWSLDDVVKLGINDQIVDFNQASYEIESQLKKSIKMQSLSDVPLGSFLSGGIDSSLVTALMQNQSSKPINTFTIGFEDKKYDESKCAAEVAKYLNTNHSELIVTASEAREVIPLLASIYDEPFADSSQIPTYLVSKLAKQKVTVTLSGDGADELFGGYNRYTQGPNLWSKLYKTPRTLRDLLGLCTGMVSTSAWDEIGEVLNNANIASRNFSQLGDKVHKVSTKLKEVKSLKDVYLNPVSEWSLDDLLVKGLKKDSLNFNERYKEKMDIISSVSHKMMFLDGATYLSDDILCKVDRASMVSSLEVRAPFLDYKLAELAWRLPIGMKIHNGQGKYILRQLLCKYVPKNLIDRPKIGFGIPIGQWLRGPLREWAEELLNEQRLYREGYLNPQPVTDAWNKHLSGKYDYSARLWAILMFQAWLEKERR